MVIDLALVEGRCEYRNLLVREDAQEDKGGKGELFVSKEGVHEEWRTD